MSTVAKMTRGFGKASGSTVAKTPRGFGKAPFFLSKGLGRRERGVAKTLPPLKGGGFWQRPHVPGQSNEVTTTDGKSKSYPEGV